MVDNDLAYGERKVPLESVTYLSMELDDLPEAFVPRRETWIVRGENKGGNRTDAFWMGIARKIVQANAYVKPGEECPLGAKQRRANGEEGKGVSDTLYTKSKFMLVPGGKPDGTDLKFMSKPKPIAEHDFSAVTEAIRRKHFPNSLEGPQRRTHREPGKNRRLREGWEHLPKWIANQDKYAPKFYSQTTEDLTHPDKPNAPKEVVDLLELVKTCYPTWIIEAEVVIYDEDSAAATAKALETALRRAEARAARRK
jgi:hypothetical protein